MLCLLGHRILNYEWTLKSKFIGIHSKGIFLFFFWIYMYVNIRYENVSFHISVIVENIRSYRL